MANEKTPVVWDDTTKKHRPLGTGEKMGGLDASSIISSDSGNLIQTGSDGLAYVSGSSIADPRADNLLETSANGKLQVTADRIAEWLSEHSDAAGALAAALADGQTVVVSGGKLVVDPSTAPKAKLQKISAALAKSGAGLSVDSSTGKLVVDFDSMDPSIMRNVVLAMVKDKGGLAVDSNGQLYVDFSRIDDATKNAILSDLSMLIPLDNNLHVYVDRNSDGDSIVDGRGTQAKPFRTIQAAVNYVTGSYSLGKWRAYIHVNAGTYTESLTLPSYASGAGFIRLESTSGSRDVVVNAAALDNGTVNFCAVVNGAGRWDIHNIEFRRTEAPTTSTTSIITGCLQASNSGAIVNLYGCAFRQIVPSDLPAFSVGYGVRIISADGGGQVNLRHGDIPHSITTSARADINVVVLNVSRGGSMYFYYSTDDALSHECVVSGSCSSFMNAWQSGAVNTAGGGSPITFNGTMTGKKYEARTGSFICVGQNASYFPGDTAGTVDDSTYCWYA